MEIALIENVQREDLNPIEEALAYQRLMQEFSLKQEEIAERVSKNRTTITNCMRLLNLAPEVQQKGGKVNRGRTDVYKRQLTRNGAEIQKTAWINCHNLIKQIWIICTCHQWDRSSLTGGNDTGAMADFRFNKIGDHLHIQKIGVCHIRFLGTSKSQQVDSVNGVFITEKRNEL